MSDDLIEKLHKDGLNCLSDKELLALISPNYPEDKLKEFHRNILTSGWEEYCKELSKDCSKKEASLICAFELLNRFAIPNKWRIQISCPKDVLPFVESYRYAEQEHLVLLTVNGANNLIGIHPITTGILDNCMAHPREIFKHCVRDNAAGFLLVHNHPSGRLVASAQDVRMTQEIKKCGELMGIPLIDHLIIGPGETLYSTVPDD